MLQWYHYLTHPSPFYGVRSLPSVYHTLSIAELWGLARARFSIEYFYLPTSMGKRDIIKSLYLGSKASRHETSESYRRFLLENIRKQGWQDVVEDMATWLHYSNFSDVEDALFDFLANDEMTKRQIS